MIAAMADEVRRAWRVAAILVFTVIPAGSASLTSGAATAPARDGLGFLCGTWAAVQGPRTIFEHWSPSRGGQRLGYTQTIVDGTVKTYETLRIDRRDGHLTLTASPANQSTVSFALARQSEGEAVFINPDHDFPQQIAYRLRDGRLIAHIYRTAAPAAEPAASWQYDRVAPCH